MKTIFYYIVCLFAMLILHGCVPSPMYEPIRMASEGTVGITFDWQHTTPGAVLPKELELHFYPEDGGADFTRAASAAGFEGELPAGNYRVLAIQSTEPGMFIAESNSYTSACVNLQPLNATNSTTENELPSASWYFGASAEQLVVKPGETTVRTLPVIQHVIPISIRIKGTGLEYIHSLSGEIAGVASCVDLASGMNHSSLPGDCCYNCFSFTTGHEVSFLLLGTVPEVGQSLSLSIVYTDGSSQKLTYNMSDALKDANSQKSQPITLECTLSIHQQAGGFDAGIVKWEIIDMGEIEPTRNH
ncbi:DUF5119 domain-containing protein [Bacteroides sp.]|uniref:DUF5119 domain-containing protein n=1 Tax=Bacteroides sp. TaxID=29523 RepID=UPI002610AC28|nr:DUF5119 domain-containing protein [Bacteroides sp.]MDD3038687.1 DUF5119 domain-containing protein [Bacteroides sp.]